MNLNTITEVRRVSGAGDEDFDWQEGDSWLAGGTWLFSEPQPHLRRLLDLQGFSWEPLVVGEQVVAHHQVAVAVDRAAVRLAATG